MKHNNVLPNQHFRKEWQERVKTWLDQPARKQRRRLARRAKAAAIAPRPASGPLRPVVRCQTVRYNMKVKAGRGFTLEELRAAGVNPKEAVTIGISVDHRRRNKSTASLNENVARLKSYLEKLALLPRKSGKKHAKAGEISAEAAKAIGQFSGAILPISQPVAPVEFVTIPASLKDSVNKAGNAVVASAYRKLRQERCNARIVGIKAKKAAAAAAAAATAAPPAAE